MKKPPFTNPYLIGIRAAVPADSVLFPENNIVGSVILCTALRQALGGPSGEFQEPIMFGELNRVTCIFSVDRELAPALREIEDFLSATMLRKYTTVLWFDAAEEIFRPHGPNNAKVEFDFTSASLALAAKEFFAGIATRMAAVEKLLSEMRKK